MDNNNLDLKAFNESCEDFLNGKYILAEYKISAILKSVTSSDKLKNIVSSCIENYNFSEEFKKVLGDNHVVTLPEDVKGIIAFCFSLLYNIESKNIAFFDFLSEYYGYNDISGLESYKSFAMHIILPFKEAINNVYMKTHILVDTVDYQNNIYNKLKKICNLVLDNIDNYKLKDVYKEEFEILINAMHDACVRNDKETVYAVLVGVDYFSLQHKKTKVVYEQFKECFERS